MRPAVVGAGNVGQAVARAAAGVGHDVVVIAIPHSAVPGVGNEISEAVASKVVIDATNPLTADGSGTAVTDRSGAEVLLAELLSATGCRPIDAGDLTAARALEHMAFLNISLNARNRWSWQCGWKLVGPTG